MKEFFERYPDKKNFVFIGEAGSGKSEISLNLAAYLVKATANPVHFFDLDQTKPLFRSRTVKEKMEEKGVIFHYEEQQADAPVTVGGVEYVLGDPESYAFLDIGGNAIGARAAGHFSNVIGTTASKVFFIINPWLPWSTDVENIDGTMSAILKTARLKEFAILGNPNLGATTTAEEFLAGKDRLHEMITEYMPVDGYFVADFLFDEVKAAVDANLYPLHPYLDYPWEG
ncbi:MAG: hypothetical protein LBK04_04175 [Clostridiales Family XIII bacterium]|jgi:hypothetical protein|nr:hypothetical protein [Clostridiales Family XIII bacterium]